MAKHSGLGLRNFLLDADAIPYSGYATFGNALSESLDIGTVVGGAGNPPAAWTRFDWGTDYAAEDIGGAELSSTEPLWIGAVVDDPVDFTFRFQRNNSQLGGWYIQPFCAMPGVCFRPMYGGLNPNDRNYDSDLSFISNSSNSDRLGLFISARSAIDGSPATVRRIWLGVPLELPYQWQSGTVGRGARQWNVQQAQTETGISGGIVTRPASGSLQAHMPHVENSWIQSKWYPALDYMSRSHFWSTLDTAGGSEEINYCWTNGSPPTVDLMPTGFSAISLRAFTYPDY